MSLVNLGTSEPSFLELIAVQRLDKGIREAFSYCLSAFAARLPSGGLGLLQWDNELHLLVALLLESTSLLANGASVSESLYGLRRVPSTHASTGTSQHLSARSRLLSLLSLTLIPYLRSILFGELTAAPIPWQHHAQQNTDLDTQQDYDSASEHAEPATQLPEYSLIRLLYTLRTRSLAAVLAASRRIQQHRAVGHTIFGCLNMAYQLRYLMNFSPVFSPAQAIASVCLQRDDGTLAVRRLQKQIDVRTHVWDAAVSQSSPSLYFLAAALRSAHAIGNNIKTSILCSLVLFKAMEWWFLTGEEQMIEASRKIPPPPPKYERHDTGIELPKDKALCPICGRRRVGPSLVATSGHVFCYKCIFHHVNRYSCCPVTKIRTSLNDIRRLFFAN